MPECATIIKIFLPKRGLHMTQDVCLITRMEKFVLFRVIS